jgi:hypothetical protein
MQLFRNNVDDALRKVSLPSGELMLLAPNDVVQNFYQDFHVQFGDENNSVETRGRYYDALDGATDVFLQCTMIPWTMF